MRDISLNQRQFLGDENRDYHFSTAQYVILPIPYEGGISYGAGTAQGPDAVLDASAYLETFDLDLEMEPIRHGICTLNPLPIIEDHQQMNETIYRATLQILESGKIPIIIGGDHSISSGEFKAFREPNKALSCIQIDAHADLRDSYMNSRFSHASVMARIRDMTPYTLHLGIRSLALEEARRVREESIAMCTMRDYRRGSFDLQAALERLPDPVFLTFDVDALDWSVVTATGTPEPGGFTWDEIVELLGLIFKEKQIAGLDCVELSYHPHDRCSPFAVAKLVYKMIGLHIQSGK